MLRLIELRPTCAVPLIAALFGTILSTLSAADSITVNGKKYENIYLGAGTDCYYIQDPLDGSMISVPKCWSELANDCSTWSGISALGS